MVVNSLVLHPMWLFNLSARIYSILVGMKQVCQFFKITQGATKLGCDGQAALDKALNYVSLIRPEDANYNILQAIWTLWAYSSIVWKFCHIKGHQHDNVALDTLDRWAKLNIEMNSRAKQHQNKACRSPRHYLLSSEPWSLWINNQKIVYDLPNTIYDFVHTEEAKAYCNNKDHLSNEVLDSVN